MKKLICLFLVLICQLASSEVVVGFFKAKDKAGVQLIQDQDRGFFHVAILHKGQWLSAMPYYGVHLASEFKHYQLVRTIKLDNMESISDKDIEPHLNKVFNFHSDWGDLTTTSCSKLVGQLLGLQPSAMTYQSQEDLNSDHVRLGLSPDEVFEILSQKKQNEKCAQTLSR